jgi:hypothetical protein
MAKTTDVPVDHWKHAGKVPADILERLSAAELRLRCAEMHRLHKAAEGAQPEHHRHLHAVALKVARSLPVVEHIVKLRRLNERASDGDYEMRQANYEMRRDLKESNYYPTGLIGDVDKAILNRPCSPDAVVIARHHKHLL